ncbi:MAG: hypothetical protein LAP40_07550 [Acidobacteriia bacterium]|nr:hypothetical protein [Terriglobia bacterium]
MDRWAITCYLDDEQKEEFEMACVSGGGRPVGPLGPFSETELRWEMKRQGQSNTQINALIHHARQHAKNREMA